MPEKDEKTIAIRFSPEEWKALDDKRQKEGSKFQSIGVRLLRQWLSGADSNPAKSPEKRVNIHKSGGISFEDLGDSEYSCILRLLKILRSGNEVAVLAITSNLLAFAGYVEAVPEASGGSPNIAALTAKLALIDKAILDAAKTDGLGRRADPQAHSGGHGGGVAGAKKVVGEARKKIR